MFQGDDTNIVNLEFKYFKKKKSKRATTVMKINSTVGELNRNPIIISIMVSDVGKDEKGRSTLYSSHRYIMTRLASMAFSNSSNKIPKSYDSIGQFSESMYDMLIFSDVEFKLE